MDTRSAACALPDSRPAHTPSAFPLRIDIANRHPCRLRSQKLRRPMHCGIHLLRQRLHGKLVPVISAEYLPERNFHPRTRGGASPREAAHTAPSPQPVPAPPAYGTTGTSSSRHNHYAATPEKASARGTCPPLLHPAPAPSCTACGSFRTVPHRESDHPSLADIRPSTSASPSDDHDRYRTDHTPAAISSRATRSNATFPLKLSGVPSRSFLDLVAHRAGNSIRRRYDFLSGAFSSGSCANTCVFRPRSHPQSAPSACDRWSTHPQSLPATPDDPSTPAARSPASKDRAKSSPSRSPATRSRWRHPRLRASLVRYDTRRTGLKCETPADAPRP